MESVENLCRVLHSCPQRLLAEAGPAPSANNKGRLRPRGCGSGVTGRGTSCALLGETGSRGYWAVNRVLRVRGRGAAAGEDNGGWMLI